GRQALLIFGPAGPRATARRLRFSALHQPERRSVGIRRQFYSCDFRQLTRASHKASAKCDKRPHIASCGQQGNVHARSTPTEGKSRFVLSRTKKLRDWHMVCFDVSVNHTTTTQQTWNPSRPNSLSIGSPIT